MSAAHGKLVAADAVGEYLREHLRDGMRLGIGGFGLDRKPMTLVREIAASAVRELTVETYAGGFDVEMLVDAGKVACVASCHVGLDHFGLAPVFRQARQQGAVAYEEWSEWTQLAAWRAAAEGVSAAIVKLDPRSALFDVNPGIRRAPSVFGGEDVVVRAPHIDLAILHVEAAHPDGWCIARGDRYLDALLARAATHVIVSAERIVDDAAIEAGHRDVHLLASYVDAVVLAPRGALPGSCIPEYLLDFAPVRRYVELSADYPARREAMRQCVFADAP